MDNIIMKHFLIHSQQLASVLSMLTSIRSFQAFPLLLDVTHPKPTAADRRHTLRRWMRCLKPKCQKQNVPLCLWLDGKDAKSFSLWLIIPQFSFSWRSCLHLIPLLQSKTHSVIVPTSLSSLQTNILLKVTAIVWQSETKRKTCQAMIKHNTIFFWLDHRSIWFSHIQRFIFAAPDCRHYISVICSLTWSEWRCRTEILSLLTGLQAVSNAVTAYLLFWITENE